MSLFFGHSRHPGGRAPALLWNTVDRLDPFVPMIDGVCYGFAAHTEGQLYTGHVEIVAGNVIPGAVCWAMFRTGYRLRP